MLNYDFSRVNNNLPEFLMPGNHLCLLHVCCNKSLFYLEIAEIIKNEYGDRYPTPTKNVPNFILYSLAPFLKMKWSFLKKNLGIRSELDNSYSKKGLGMTYKSIEETIIDHAKQIINDGLVK